MKSQTAGRPTIWTIGYEAATVAGFLRALSAAGIGLLVDVRAVASSRRAGFAKSRLAANLHGAGIEYLHLRGLGTPPDGRAAARAGRHEELRRIYLEHLGSAGTGAELERLGDLVASGSRVCLMCLEADPAHCHRSLVAEALSSLTPVTVVHLAPDE